jgi:hypothetical protein
MCAHAREREREGGCVFVSECVRDRDQHTRARTHTHTHTHRERENMCVRVSVHACVLLAHRATARSFRPPLPLEPRIGPRPPRHCRCCSGCCLMTASTSRSRSPSRRPRRRSWCRVRGRCLPEKTSGAGVPIRASLGGEPCFDCAPRPARLLSAAARNLESARLLRLRWRCGGDLVRHAGMLAGPHSLHTHPRHPPHPAPLKLRVCRHPPEEGGGRRARGAAGGGPVGRQPHSRAGGDDATRPQQHACRRARFHTHSGTIPAPHASQPPFSPARVAPCSASAGSGDAQQRSDIQTSRPDRWPPAGSTWSWRAPRMRCS